VFSALADALDARHYHLIAHVTPGLHPTRTARIDVDGVPVGYVVRWTPGCWTLSGWANGWDGWKST